MMTDLQKEYAEDAWKIALRSEIITAMTGEPAEIDRAHAEVGYYYQCCAPASLYKYYSDKPVNLDAVRNNKMWYSAPCNFNDVFDCDIAIDEQAVFNSALKLFPDKRGMRAGSPMWKNLRLEVNRALKLLRDQFDALRNTTGVSCFSESDDSLLMWAHYANNHRGICVEYDLLEVSAKLGFSAVPVIYSDDRTCFNFLNLQTIEKDSLGIFIQSLTSKSPEWDYEKEWRIVRDQEACGENWNDGKKGALLEMICPSSVILGCAAQPEFEKEVKEYCNSNKINLYQMEKDKGKYQLNRKPILEFDKAENSDK
ncbi:MAG: DUF2971 domain-containing protein [Oscillibacter sp.]|nr:DUF2971 domain-containing protein [Oscillibacter sp.]MBD5155737.1 DUF2971 domain-containing protein [Oscillibacter sp.]